MSIGKKTKKKGPKQPRPKQRKRPKTEPEDSEEEETKEMPGENSEEDDSGAQEAPEEESEDMLDDDLEEEEAEEEMSEENLETEEEMSEENLETEEEIPEENLEAEDLNNEESEEDDANEEKQTQVNKVKLPARIVKRYAKKKEKKKHKRNKRLLLHFLYCLGIVVTLFAMYKASTPPGTQHSLTLVNFMDMQPYYNPGDFLIGLNTTQKGDPIQIRKYDNVVFLHQNGNVVAQHVVDVTVKNGVEQYLVQGRCSELSLARNDCEANKLTKLSREQIVGRVVKVFKTSRYNGATLVVKLWEWTGWIGVTVVGALFYWASYWYFNVCKHEIFM